MTVVVILRRGKGDRLVESRKVKAFGGWEIPGSIRTGGRATWQAVAKAKAKVNRLNSEMSAPRETDCGIVESAEPLRSWRRLLSASSYWTYSMAELSGVMKAACQEGIDSESSEPLVGRLGAPAQRRHRV
jgi:hypothetical protein